MTDAPVPFDLQRMNRYFEWCDALRAKLVPEAVISFRFSSVKIVKLPLGTGLIELLAVCEMLRFDNVIHTLDCSNVHIGDHGAIVIAELLPLASNLKYVILSNCGIKEMGGVALMRGVLLAPCIQRLVLDGNELGYGGAVALGRVLRRTRTLSYVDVSRNALQRSGVTEITHALVHRAQRRLDKARRQHISAAAAATQGLPADAGGMAGESARSRAPSAEDLSLLEHPSASPNLQSAGGLWGVLFGDVSELVVTTDAVVHTIWKSGPMNDRGKQSQGPSHGLDSGGLSSAHHSRAAATLQQASEDDLDIEVRIAGNFVFDETVNAAIHATGLIGAVCGAIPLLRNAQQADDYWQAVGVSVYCLTLVAFFASATANHALFMVDSVLFRTMDHSAAFGLIAGTYTPFLLTNLGFHPLGSGLLALVWGLALVGILLSTACRTSVFQRRMRVLLYGLMGWMGLIPYAITRSCVQTDGWRLLLGGGLLFSMGILLYSRERRAASTIFSWWYLLVLISCAAHYAAVFAYVQPPSEACLLDAAAHGLRGRAPLGAVEEARHASGPIEMVSLGLSEALVAVQQGASFAARSQQKAAVDSVRVLLKDALERLEKAQAGHGDL